MIDEREKKLAHIFVNHSLTVKKGDIIKITCGIEAKSLVLETCRLILEKGAIPRVDVDLPGFAYTFFKHAPPEVLTTYPKIADYEARNVDGMIRISCDRNTREMSSINPKKQAERRLVTKEISEITLKKDNWVIFDYPTEALAQDAEMSLEEFEDFVYGACLVDYDEMSRKEDILKEVLDKGNDVHIVGKNTDLRFSIKGREGIKCCGNRNIPDGECFIAPVETSTEGHIEYDFPAIYGGREVDGVRLEFKEGKVVKATAKKNEAYLNEMLNIDKGARYLGEFGWGINYGIKKFVKQILFDEKIGGTIHLALGMAYKQGGGVNDSALHWDMIKDLRKEGAVYVDGKCIMKEGKFTIF
ncbi:MAG TPA: aminopeptidase [Candidatus Nanoarchaeia archaeon]|nr:aminopeptidase [Candidatus Nanoarchaeia archaeon]